MRGKKGVPHTDPDDPPRRRANKARGHGTWDNDRPPVCGVVGRESGHARLTVAAHPDGATLRRVVRRASWPMAMVNTDEWRGYNGLPAMGRRRATVCHAEREWARRVVERAAGSGGAAVAIDGRMVDKPVLLRAQAILREAN